METRKKIPFVNPGGIKYADCYVQKNNTFAVGRNRWHG